MSPYTFLLAYGILATSETIFAKSLDKYDPCGLYDDWTLIGDTWYLVVNKPLTWSEAKSDCLTMCSNLVVIHDSSKNQIVQNLASTTKTFVPWLGLHRDSESDNFSWVDGSSVDYSNWMPDQPNGGNCAWMDKQGQWSVGYGCSSSSGYICEKSNNSTSRTTSTATEMPRTSATAPCDLTAVKQDIMFIFDSSSYMPSVAFEAIQNMIGQFLSQVTIGADNVRVGLMTFDLEGLLWVTYNTYYDYERINRTIHALFQNNYNAQNIASALQLQIDLAQNSADGFRQGDATVGHLAVLFSSHSWTGDSPLPLLPALHKLFINVVAVGYGEGADYGELTQLTNPDCVIHASNTNDLYDRVPPFLAQSICNVPGTMYCQANP